MNERSVVEEENTMMRERDIEQLLVREVRKNGGRAYKFISPGNDGVPDRIVLMPDGKIYFVELKTLHGKESALQHAQRRRISELGQIVFVVYGLKGLADFFKATGFPESSDLIAAIAEMMREKQA